MIVDSHCHAWRRWPYEPPVPDPDSRGRVEQLLFEMDQHSVDMAAIVCARIGGNDDNVAYAIEAAAAHPGRILAFPDLDCSWSAHYHRPGVADRLRALLDLGPVCGISHYLDERNDGWLRSEEARALFALAQEHELLVTLAVQPEWHADLRTLAADFPTVPVLCNHLGLSRTPAELDDLMRSAAVPSILIKVSGWYYGAPGYRLPREWDFPYAGTLAREAERRIYETFGPHRMCWGSDYPVSRERMTYRQTLEAFRTHCDFVAPADRELVLGGTFARLLETRRPLEP